MTSVAASRPPTRRLAYRFAGNATVPVLPGSTGIGQASDTPSNSRPPFAPQTLSLGNPPAILPDLPATAVFLVLFLTIGIINIRLFFMNRRNDHKFMFSIASFVFCAVRVVSCCLRLSWVYNPQAIRLAIAAQIFVAAGTVVLFIINLFFVQRLVRARHPQIGWHAPFKILVPYGTVVITVLTLVMVITCVIQQFYTLDPHTHAVDAIVLLYALTWFAFVAFLPIPIVVLMGCIKRRTYIDKFGAGRFRTKVAVLLASSVLLTLGAAFRAGIQYLPPTRLAALRSGAVLPWYLGKAAFYCFDFGVELLVILLYVMLRVDKRFYVPDAVAGPGEYAGEFVEEKPRVDVAGDVYAASADRRSMSLVMQAPGTQSSPSTTTFSDTALSQRHVHSYSHTGDWEIAQRPATSASDHDGGGYLEYDVRRKRYEIRRPESTVSLASEAGVSVEQDRISRVAEVRVPIPGSRIDGRGIERLASTRSTSSRLSRQ